LGQNALNGLGFLADSWLRLVVSEPAQAAGVEVNLHEQSLTHAFLYASSPNGPLSAQHSAFSFQQPPTAMRWLIAESRSPTAF